MADVVEVPNLLHGKERHVFGDAGYTGAQKRAPKRGRKFWIAAKRSVVKAIEDPELRAITEQLEHAKASIRAAVEYPFWVLKRQFGYVKVRYKGLMKNGAQVTTLFALINLWMARRTLLHATWDYCIRGGLTRPAAAREARRLAQNLHAFCSSRLNHTRK